MKQIDPSKLYDVVIVGAGTAGLAVTPAKVTPGR
jgi:cation diffusion facilitator CzcD-associated flavoprotein CzcO